MATRDTLVRRFAPSLTALAVLALAACDQPPDTPRAKRKPAARAHLVEVVTVQAERLVHTTQRTGTLAARRSVRIFNQEEGRIEQLAVHEGSPVKQGQVLVRLDARLLAVQLDKAVATRKQAEDDLKRIKALSAKRVATRERLGQAETQLSVAKAEEALIRTRLDYAEIKAPFDGIVTERRVEPGDVAPRHSHLLTLIDPKTLYTKVAVSELMLPRLKVGSGVDVRIDALGDKVWPGRLGRIHPTVDPRTRQGLVEVEMVEVPASASAGQLCRVTLRAPEVIRKVVPFAALRHDQQGEYIFLVTDGKAALRRTRTGLRLDDRVEVLDGIEAGDKVVVRGFLDLAPGKPVSIVDRAANGAPSS